MMASNFRIAQMAPYVSRFPKDWSVGGIVKGRALYT